MEKPFPAYRGNDAYVFVCYAHEDTGVVYPELKRLQGKGANLWYDEGISPGHEWTQNIADAIDGAALVLFFISPSSVNSRHCRNEVQYALEQEKSIVSVYISPTELPGGLKLSIGSAQAILMYAETPEDYQRKIGAALSDWISSPVVIGSSQSKSKAGSWLAGAGLALVLAVAGAAWWFQNRSVPESQETAERGAEIQGGRSVAVLPFLNQSDDPSQEFFSEGLSEDILNELARSANLTVRPRSSSFLFKGSDQDSRSIGRQLNVTHVLEGAVRRAGTQVRVTAQLIDVNQNRSVWSGRYDRELDDVFAVQDTITAEIYSALSMQLELQPSRREVVDSGSYDAFLRGRYHFSRANYGEAERWFAKSTDLSPENAEAWAMRGHVNAYLSANGVLPNIGPNRLLRRSYLQQSLLLDPNNVTALANRALMDTHYVARDYQAALDELARLSRLHPNNEDVLIYLTFVLATLGEADLVRQTTARLIQLSPFSANAWLVRVYYGGLLFGPKEQAVVDHSEMGRFGLTVPLLTAEIALVQGDRLDLAAPTAAGDWPPQMYAIASATEAYLRGDYDQAAKIVAPFNGRPGYVPYSLKMRIALLERNLDLAFASLRSAIREAEQLAISTIQGTVLSRETFPEFYADPRYEQLLRELKLDDVSVTAISIPDLSFLYQ